MNTVLMATADRDGRFVIPAAGPEPLRILVEAEGYVRVKREIPLPAEAEVLVEMTPALEVRGVVRTPEGTPLGSISVALSGRKSDSRPGIAAYANSAADGTFRIGGLAAGEYRLSARPPFGSASPLLPVEMEGVTAGATDVVVVMTPGGAISGRVTGEDGRPVALASVSVYRPDGRRLSGTRADGEGAFTIGGLEGGPFRLRASAPDAPRWMGHDFSYGGRYLGAEREGVAAGTDDLAIRLPVGETIAGTVRDRDGRPVGGEWVRAVLLPGQDEAKASMGGYAIQAGRTDADGTFEIAGLAPGRYRLDWSWAPGMNARAAILPLAGGESVAAGSANVRLTAGRPGDVRGTVTDEDGAPVAGVRVEVVPIGAAGGMSGKSGEDGAFVVPGLSGLFPYRLTVEARDYLPATVERVQAGQQGVAVRLSRGLSAAGRLLGADGAPKAKTSVRLTHETGKHQASFRTDEVGRFSVSGLMEGAYRVEVNRGRLVNGSFFADGGALEAGASGVVLRVPD